jgi:ABC-2 type transport system permease protein
MKLSTTTRLTSILVREQFREPIGIFWSLVAPVALFCFANLGRGKALTEGDEFLNKAAWYLAYISFTTALFGFGLYLVGRRESGFVRSFAYTRRARNQFGVAQLCGSFLLTLAYGAFFLLIVSVVFRVIPSAADAIAVLLRFAVVTVIFMVGCLVFSALPLTFQNASNLLSIFSMPLIMLGLASTQFGSSSMNWVNAFNPYFAAGLFIASPSVAVAAIYPVVHAMALLMFGYVGLSRFGVSPVWSRY